MTDMIPNDVMKRACEWIVGRGTGSSSKALWAVMMGVKSDGSYPSDGGDLGRCLRLLEAVPEWEARLPEMAAVSPYWAALVQHWPELKGLHKSSDDSLYKRMKAILDPIEDRDPNVVRMGPGITMHFGR